MKVKRLMALALAVLLTFGSPACVWAAANEFDEMKDPGRSAFPSSFNLIDQGLVTPLKCQAPFGTCWAFGSISTLETAVLNELGMTYDEALAVGGEIAPLLDLSEKHLAWFTYQGLPASVDPSQAGEGMVIKNQEQNFSEVYNMGGFPVYSAAFLANCGGPATEKAIPYQGKTGLREWEFMEAHKQEIIESYMADGYTRVEAEEKYRTDLESKKKSNEPSYFDDWSLDDGQWKVTSPITIRNANYLPNTILVDSDFNYAGLDFRSVELMKQELYSGHSIAMSYDASSGFLNEDTWGYYCPELSWTDHRVCIVGWDDNFKRENFGFNPDGEYYGPYYYPEGDGAWLVKNSWGSYPDDTSEEKEDLRDNKWKLDGDGYFYISYYDRSLSGLESVDITLDMEKTEQETAHQYDYCILDSYDGSYTPNEVSTANIFKTRGNERITALAARSHAENSRIKMEVYLLNEDPTDPRDGILLWTDNESFPYMGYHRIDLDREVYVPANSSYSVIVTEMVTYNNSSVQYVKGEDVAICPTERGMRSIEDLVDYKKIIVNPGESFCYENGKWTDLADNYKYELTADSLNSIFNRKVDDAFTLKRFGKSLSKTKEDNVLCADNYCIKSFTVDAPEYVPEPDDPTMVIEGKCYTAGTGADTASYQVISTLDRTVKYRGSKSAETGSKVVIPDSVVLGDNMEYTVVGISQGAFAETPNVKTLILNAYSLEEDHTHGCLLSSKVKTVMVKVGSANDNKFFRRQYSPIFKKNHCGKKVKLK